MHGVWGFEKVGQRLFLLSILVMLLQTFSNVHTVKNMGKAGY